MTIKLTFRKKPVVVLGVRSLREAADRYRLHLHDGSKVYYNKKETTHMRLIKHS